MEKETRDINVVCPDHLQLLLIQSGRFPHAHYFTKKEVLKASFPFYEDQDILSFAQKEGKTFASSKKAFDNFSLFKEDLKEYLTYTVKVLANQRKKALEYRLLHEPDYLLSYSLKKRPCLILGYHEEDRDLVEALNHLGMDFNACHTSILDFFNIHNAKNVVYRFNESWIEVMFGLSWLARKIEEHSKKGHLDFYEFQIVCPASYNNILSSSSSLFNIPLSLPIDAIKNIPEASDIIETFQSKSLSQLSSEIGSLKNNEVRSRITKALQTLTQVTGLNEELKQEYLTQALENPYTFDKGLKGITVHNALADASPTTVLLVLGFSDSLVPSKKDNGAIADAVKGQVTYEPSTVFQNRSTEQSVKEVLNLSSNVRISKSDNDNFDAYPDVFFLKNGWLEEKEWDDDKTYESYGMEEDGVRKDLALYQAVFHSRYDKIRLRDPLAYSIDKNAKKSASLFHSYQNDFDDDKKTQDYFRNYYADKPIYLSHSSLDTYQNNPFNFFCSNILKLRSPTNFITLAGQLIHSHAELRKDFNLDKKLTSLSEDLPEELDGMNRNQVLYFLKNADLVFQEFILPGLEETERKIALTQVRPKENEEYKLRSPLPLNSIATAYFDQVYSRNDGYVLVDYKTGSKSDYYVGLLEAMFGRKLQLPFYSILFAMEKGTLPGIDSSKDLLGSFICNVPYSKAAKKKGVFVGFQFAKEDLYVKEKGERTSCVKRLDQVNKEDSKGDVTSMYLMVEDVKLMQDKMTENLSFGKEADATYPSGSPKTMNLSLAERIVSMALTSYYHCVSCLRNGRLKTEEGIRWFPVYPASIFSKGKNNKIGFDDFGDISFVEDFQVHQLINVKKEDLENLTYNDFDNLQISKEALLSEGEDDVDEDDFDDEEDE